MTTLATLFALANAAAAQAPSECPAGTRLVEERRVETATAIYIQPICEADAAAEAPAPPLYAAGFTTEEAFIGAALALARGEGWATDEIARLRTALEAARDFEPAEDKVQIKAIWAALDRRAADPALAASANAGIGDKLLASGWQSGRYDDCVLFAIATASGQPYGVVAARANELIKAAPWRSDSYRRSPEAVFSRGGGLNDYEAALLAEAFGQVATVEPAGYVAALRSGRAIVLPVATRGQTGHEIVLARTFRHGGKDWFEAIDSTKAAPLYIDSTELGAIALAKGLMVRAEPGRPIPLVRGNRH